MKFVLATECSLMDADEPSRPPTPRRRGLRIFVGTLLVLILLASLALLFFRWPLQLPVAASLIVISAAPAGVFAAYFVPNKLPERVKRGFAVFGAALAVIGTLIALPAITFKPPLTAALDFGQCEKFAVPTNSLSSVPSGTRLDAKWAYENGGATTSRVLSLTVQGTSQDAVVLRGLRIIGLEAKTAPSNTAELLPCGRVRPAVVPIRYFELNLDDPPQVKASPAEANPQTGDIEPATEFPYQVSNSQPEFFTLIIKGPNCVCEWQLALDWIAGGRSGTLIVDRGFGKVRSDISGDDQRPRYSRHSDGTWDPPLPK
jgi:hypothetical protein